MCDTNRDEGREFHPKEGGVAFKNERVAAERHRYFYDREKLLMEKDLRIIVAITEKSYFF